MKIILEHHHHISGCFNSKHTVVIPIDYPSLDDARFNFFDLVKTHKTNFYFCGILFYIKDFKDVTSGEIIELPQFMTLEEWFDKNVARDLITN